MAPVTGVTSGDTIPLPTAPTKAGYLFAGWYTGTNGTGTAFNATTPVTADLTVYSKWTLNPAASTALPYTGGDPTAPGSPRDLPFWILLTGSIAILASIFSGTALIRRRARI